MISIICVYNNQKSFENNLLAGLKKQDAVFELIPVNNTNQKFHSAARALNWGAGKAKGKYLIFAHQDVVLEDKSWLRQVEKILDNLPDLGIAGVAGLDLKNQRVGFLNDSGRPWGKRFSQPQKAQTLDECLLVIPAKVFKMMPFDEKNFDHWHCYGVDYCLSAAELGLAVDVLPALIHHNSPGRNLVNLFEYQKRIWQKHRQNYQYICTTCGFLSCSTVGLKARFPKSKLVDFYWRVAGISPIGQLYQNLAKRAFQAAIRKTKQLTMSKEQ